MRKRRKIRDRVSCLQQLRHGFAVAHVFSRIDPECAHEGREQIGRRNRAFTVREFANRRGQELIDVGFSVDEIRFEFRDITIVGERKMVTFDDMNISEPVRVYDKRVAETVTQVQLVDTFAGFRASVR